MFLCILVSCLGVRFLDIHHTQKIVSVFHKKILREFHIPHLGHSRNKAASSKAAWRQLAWDCWHPNDARVSFHLALRLRLEHLHLPPKCEACSRVETENHVDISYIHDHYISAFCSKHCLKIANINFFQKKTSWIHHFQDVRCGHSGNKQISYGKAPITRHDALPKFNQLIIRQGSKVRCHWRMRPRRDVHCPAKVIDCRVYIYICVCVHCMFHHFSYLMCISLMFDI